MGAITKAQNNKVAKAQGGDFKGLLEEQWPRIASVAPKHMSKDRLFQLAMAAYKQTPKLAECSVFSVLSCIMQCAALGMEPSAVDGLGRAYIIPFYNRKTGGMEATFILGYRGMIDLARRSGEVESISARAVYEGDYFDYEYGLNESCRHIPSDVEHTPDKLTHVYCVAHFKDGGHYIDVMTKSEVDAIRKRSKSPNSGPWVTDYEAMACKSVVRRAFKYLPVSVESAQAVSQDETTPHFASVDDVPDITDADIPAGVDADTGEIIEDEGESADE